MINRGDNDFFLVNLTNGKEMRLAPHAGPGSFSIGAGTVIRFQMCVFGKTQNFSASIAEPQPGCVLMETGLNSGVVKTFMIDLVTNGQHAQATIATTLQARNTISGRLERFFTSIFLRRIYAAELKLLAALAEKPLQATQSMNQFAPRRV